MLVYIQTMLSFFHIEEGEAARKRIAEVVVTELKDKIVSLKRGTENNDYNRALSDVHQKITGHIFMEFCDHPVGSQFPTDMYTIVCFKCDWKRINYPNNK